jgi:hypothetical protein
MEVGMNKEQNAAAEYPDDEQLALTKLNVLMGEWKSQVGKYTVWDPESQRKYPAAEYFCSDGFYPYYYAQTPKILFIARETVEMEGANYIEELLKAYHADLVAGVSVNRHAFHSRMMYIAQGAIKEHCEKPYEDLPCASAIAKTLGTPEGVSFAFMELSKYMNCGEDANAHCSTELMKQFLEDSCLDTTRFIQQEMEILAPDIIITMNLWECGINAALIEKALGHVSQICGNIYLPHATLNKVSIGERQVPLIDMAHFSSRKSHKEAFYDPAMNIMRDLKARGMLQ